MVGPATWAVSVTPVGGGAVGTAAGLLPYTGPITVDAVVLVRPAGAGAGHFVVDDLKAVSIKLNVK